MDYPIAHPSPLPAHDRMLCRILLLLLLVCFVTACGGYDFSVHRQNFNPRTSASNQLATFAVRFTDDTAPHAMHLTRTKRGYAVEMPLLDQKHDGLDLTLMEERARDASGFLGLRGRVEF